MAFKVTTVYKRPSLDIPWHTQWFFGKCTQEFLDCQSRFNMEQRRTVKGDDTLTLTIENTWDSEEHCSEYTNHPAVVYHAARVDEYHESCGITKEPRVYEEL